MGYDQDVCGLSESRTLFGEFTFTVALFPRPKKCLPNGEVCKMAFGGSSLLASRVRSQSDSDLLGPKPDQNGVIDPSTIRRNTSMEDLSSTGRSKRRNFFFRLVRPWKWRIRKHKGKHSPTSEFMGLCVRVL